LRIGANTKLHKKRMPPMGSILACGGYFRLLCEAGEMGFGGQKRIRIWYHAAPPCSEEEMPSLTKPNLA
jgi:hypothetical protein